MSWGRTGAMAVLANGCPLLTTSGQSTEQFWLDCDAIAIVPTGDVDVLVARAAQLLIDAAERGRMAAAGLKFYGAWFDVLFSVQVLRGSSEVLREDFLSVQILKID